MSNRQFMPMLELITAGGQVQRCHTVPCLHPQSVAAHSYGVAWWCWLLTQGKPTATLLMAALSHDIAETETGDLPAPTKRALGVGASLQAIEDGILKQAGITLPMLYVEEARLLKLADSMDLLWYCVQENRLGNRVPQLVQMFNTITEYAYENAADDKERSIIAMVCEQWRE